MPLASAKFILFHNNHPDHIFRQVSHTVTHIAKPVEKPIEQPIKATKQINKVVAPVEKTSEDAGKAIAQVPNEDADSVEKISSDVGKAGEDAQKAMEQVPGDINTFGAGMTNAIQNPADGAKTFMIAELA